MLEIWEIEIVRGEVLFKSKLSHFVGNNVETFLGCYFWLLFDPVGSLGGSVRNSYPVRGDL